MLYLIWSTKILQSRSSAIDSNKPLATDDVDNIASSQTVPHSSSSSENNGYLLNGK